MGLDAVLPENEKMKGFRTWFEAKTVDQWGGGKHIYTSLYPDAGNLQPLNLMLLMLRTRSHTPLPNDPKPLISRPGKSKPLDLKR